MKKIFTLLTFVFMTSAMLFGQCSDKAGRNSGGKRYFLTFLVEADRTAFLNDVTSIVLPLEPSGEVTVPVGDLDLLENGAGEFVLRANGSGSNGYFGGSFPFTGSLTLNLAAGGTLVCSYFENALPVDLVSFDGIKRDQQINLNWQTASEINNEGFVIERGHKIASDLEWNQLDFVAGSGTAYALNAYSFTDRNPEEGINYYRLKQMDYDGGYEYSSVITVEYSRKEGNTIEIFPNPVKNQLTLTNGAGEAIIYNALGQAVKHLTIDANRATIQLEGLLSGQYYIQVLQADGTMITKQFSKVD